MYCVVLYVYRHCPGHAEIDDARGSGASEIDNILELGALGKWMTPGGIRCSLRSMISVAGAEEDTFNLRRRRAIETLEDVLDWMVE